MRHRLFIDRKANTATSIATTGGNNPTKHAELTWICEDEKDFEKVIAMYPKAEIV